jgi:hypothetical protein
VASRFDQTNALTTDIALSGGQVLAASQSDAQALQTLCYLGSGNSYVASITALNWDEVTDFRPVLYEVRKGLGWQGRQVPGRVAYPPFNVQGNGTYWLAAYSQPTAGLQVYSEELQSFAVTGVQIVRNVIAT